jgi:hypothetical protein
MPMRLEITQDQRRHFGVDGFQLAASPQFGDACRDRVARIKMPSLVLILRTRSAIS